MRHVKLFLGVLLWCAATGVWAQGAPTNYPATETCQADRSSSFNSGFNEGFSTGSAQGFNQGFTEGYGHGADDGAAFCIANPALCGITLASCLPAPSYGETEPNDNIVAANGMSFDVPFWGQSYGPADEDWFYIVTSRANQNLTINFSVPTGSISGYRVAIRDAAGNLFADFDTSAPGSVPAPEGEVAYRVTLGFAGTYYVVVQTAPGTTNYSTYHVSATLQDSPLDAPNLVVGFYDTELEPNNLPGDSTWLTEGVTMYGTVNLTFDEAVPAGTGREWAQGEPDWYAYYSSGAEVATLTFCAREECEPGNWHVEVYGFNEANAVAGGAIAPALLGINTDTNSTSAPLTYRVGLPNAGIYYVRVNHKRLFSAPCAAYGFDYDRNGIADTGAGTCSCASGESCDISAVIPKSFGTSLTGDGEGAETQYFCPDGESGTEVSATQMKCNLSCQCVAWRGVVEIPEGAVTSQYNFTWSSTKLPPNTFATDAFQDYLGRPTPY